MASFGSNNSIADEIRSGCNIVDVIGQVVRLKRAGANYKGLCPFHSEKTPSFVVSEEKQIFTCFGCGATGNVIGFTERYYGLDFRGACEKLAKENNIDISGRFGGRADTQELYDINREAAAFFYKALTEKANPGYTYMKKRGIEPATIKRFGIGFADGGWQTIEEHFDAQGTDRDKLAELGLLAKKRGGDGYYDKFRNRVMFPIINTNGKVIGFGGREIDGSEPKYLNSPESAVFQKKNNLYGLNTTKQDISKEDCVFIVEGYMDVISLYQSGIKNVTASLGTALTENQATLIKRYTKNVILCYDSDAAGINATMRGLDILYAAGCRVRAMHVDDGKDPDEYIKKHGRTAFLKLSESALSYGDYKLEAAKKRHDTQTTEGLTSFLNEAVAILKSMRPVEADVYVQKLAKDMHISEGAIRSELAGKGRKTAEKPRPREDVENAREDGGTVSEMEKGILKLIVTDPSYYRKQREFADAFTSYTGREILAAFGAVYKEGEPIDMERISGMLGEEARDVLSDITENVRFAGKDADVFRDFISSIERKRLEERLKELKLMLSVADEEENAGSIRNIMKEQQEIAVKLQELRKK